MRHALALALVLAGAAPGGAFPYNGREVPDDLPAPAVRRAPVTIGSLNQNDAQGYSVLEFQQVTIRGIVQLGTGVVDPFDAVTPSTWFYVADGTGGVAVSWSGQRPTAVAAGDSVAVTATVFTQGLTPIQGTRTVDLGIGTTQVMVLGTGTVTPPAPVTGADIATGGAAWEGSRVQVSGVTLVNPGAWPASGRSAFVNATDGVTQFRIYVDDDTDLDGQTPPGAGFDLVGFVLQDDPTQPFTSGYYVLPTGSADIVQGNGSGTMSVAPAVVPEDATGVTLDFTLTGQSATVETVEIDIPTGWSWSPSITDLTLSGPGYAAATASFTGTSPITLRVTGAAVTASEPGTLSVANLASPTSPGFTTFQTRTAVAGGSPSPISSSPRVNVVTGAVPGDVVINEVYPVTLSENEEAEFIELFNRTSADLEISGWTLGDVGRTAGCDLDVRWAFPMGTVLPAGGYLVVCRTARDPQGPGATDDQGFLVEFPSIPAGVPLYEMFDLESPQDAVFGDQSVAMDDPSVPNLVLLSDAVGDDQIALLGGLVTNVGQCPDPADPTRLVPFTELVVLQDVLGTAIDAFEYRESGPCTTDLCTGPYTGPDDAYPFGAPKPGHSLGRDAAGTDTDVSRDDILPSSNPSPGAPNVPGDTVPPEITVVAGLAITSGLLDVRFDEPVQDATALDPGAYAVTGPAGQSYAVLEVFPNPEEVFRRYYLITEPMPAGFTGTLSAKGVRDLVVGGGGGNPSDTSTPLQVGGGAPPVCTVQDYDDLGFSPLQGQTVRIAGYVSVGAIPAVGPLDPPPVERVSIWVQQPGGCGVNVFAFLPDDASDYNLNYPDIRRFGVRLDDFVVVEGRVTDFISGTGSGAVTEIESLETPGFYRLLLRGSGAATPLEVTTAAANDEGLEGTLVHTEGTVINSNDLAAWIDDGSGAIQVFQNFSALDLTRFTVGDRLDVTGVITQFDASEPYLSGYELVPRSQEYIFKVDGGFASGGPVVQVEKRVLVPDTGETIGILTRSPARSDMIVEIYDAVGRKVTTLYDGIGLGEMSFRWDGRDQDGQAVDPGVYLCHARAVPLDGGNIETLAAPIVVGLRLDGSPPIFGIEQ